MNRLKMLALLPSLCLASCSQASFYGVYEFRLGKTDGAHFGISVELKEGACEGHDGYQNFSLKADLGSDYSIESLLKDYSDDPIIQQLIEDFVKVLPEDRTIPGYYQITDYNNAKYGYRVKLGSDFLEDLVEKLFPSLKELEEIVSSFATPEVIEMLLCSYVNDKQFTLQIPVSLYDAQYQLAWYGFYIDPNGARLLAPLDQDKLPGPKGEERIGVHPALTKNEKGEVVASEVDDMNEIFEFEFSHTYLYQKDEDGVRVPTGSFLERPNEKNEKVLYFKPFDEKMSLNNIEGEVAITSLFGSSVYKPIKFSATPNAREVSEITYNGKTGIDEGFVDKNGNEFTFKELMKAPFEFRDFHDVKVGLTKAE